MTLCWVYPKIGLVYTGHHRTLANVSNGILTGLTDHRKTRVTTFSNLLFF